MTVRSVLHAAALGDAEAADGARLLAAEIDNPVLRMSAVLAGPERRGHEPSRRAEALCRLICVARGGGAPAGAGRDGLGFVNASFGLTLPYDTTNGDMVDAGLTDPLTLGFHYCTCWR